MLWRGGEAQAIPKANKSLRDVSGWRSILLMEIAAKGVGKCLRNDLLAIFAQHGADLHGGSRRGMPLEIPMHAERAHGQRLKRLKATGAVIFLDGANALYSVIREHLYSCDSLSRPDLIDGLARAAFQSENDQMQLLATLAAPGVLQASDAPAALVSYLRHTLHASWFAMRGSSACIFQTLTGTGPGAPLADILFQLALTRFHATVNEAMDEAGLRYSSVRSSAKTPIPGWADDLAIMLEAPAAAIVDTIRQTARIAHRAMAETGVTVNFGAGKTEVVPLLYGPGSATVKQDLLAQEVPTIAVELCSGDITHLRVVKEYVHLGGVFSHDANSSHDIERRRRECELPFRRLRATLLRNPCLLAKEKVHLLCSLILPKLLHGASLWYLRRSQDELAFRAAIMGFLRRSVRPILNVSSALATDLEVCTALQVLTPDEVLTRLHVMQLAFLADFASAWLMEAITSAATWLEHAAASLTKAGALVGWTGHPPNSLIWVHGSLAGNCNFARLHGATRRPASRLDDRL